jgi:hypothetical protein
VLELLADIYEGTACALCGWFREERVYDFWYGNSKSGFNNTAIMIERIQIVFEPRTRPEDPNEWRLLIFDGFDVHLDPDVVDFAIDHNIMLLLAISLYPRGSASRQSCLWTAGERLPSFAK